MTRVNRHWLLANALAFVPLVVYLYVRTISDGKKIGAEYGTFEHIALLFASTAVAGLASLFLVGIPLRIGLNLLIKDRRSSYRWETTALVVAFMALCGMLYSMYSNRMEG